MRGFVAVFRREIFVGRLVLAAAAAASLVPFVGPLARGISGDAAADERASIALVVAAAFAAGLSIALGASTAAPAIANRRITFDFARPISGRAIWLGRAAGSAVLVVGSATITVLPAMIAGARFAPRDFITDAALGRQWPALAAAALAVLFFAAHAISVMVRSRSALLALDLVLGAACGLIVARTLAQLPEPAGFTPGQRLVIVWSLVVAGLIALFAACFASVTGGRSDIRAAHRSLSKTLWSVAGASVAAAAAYTSWVLGAGPGDLRGFAAEAAPRGSWVDLAGEARGAATMLLFDTATGRVQRHTSMMWQAASFSPDGKRAAWVQSTGRRAPFEVMTLALDRPDKPRHTRVLFAFPPQLVLSHDGSRLASLGPGPIALYDLQTGQLLAAGAVHGGTVTDQRAFFVDPDRLRVYVQLSDGRDTRRLEILELDASTRVLRRLGSRELPKGGAVLIADRAGDRVIAVAFAAQQAMLLDGRTGDDIATLAAGGQAGTTRWARFLGDGRIVLSESSPEGSSLSVFDARGANPRVQRLDARWVRLGGEITPGRLLIATERESREHGSGWIVDVDGGRMKSLGPDLSPLGSGFAAAPNQTLEPGSEVARLLMRGDHELVRVDPATGESRVVLRSKPPR